MTQKEFDIKMAELTASQREEIAPLEQAFKDAVLTKSSIKQQILEFKIMEQKSHDKMVEAQQAIKDINRRYSDLRHQFRIENPIDASTDGLTSNERRNLWYQEHKAKEDNAEQ